MNFFSRNISLGELDKKTYPHPLYFLFMDGRAPPKLVFRPKHEN